MALSIDWKALLGDFVMGAKKPLVVVLGSTASGKTAFAMEVASSLPTLQKRAEIVNADSRQLYRFLDIGTAKPTAEQRQGGPHHLFDVLDPKDEVTVAWYKREAERTIDGILGRGNVPVLVGGSMLYLSAVIDGLEPLSPVDPALRRRLDEAYEQDGGKTLHARLEGVDPAAARSIHPHNKPFIIRALEIYESTGLPASVQKQTSTCPYDLLIVGMQRPREELRRRIARRTRQMLASGWVEEVQGLLAQGYGVDDPAMQSCGYREIAERLLRDEDPSSLKEDPELAEEIAAKTRRYAKRQETWWRGDLRIRWIHPDVARSP